MNGDEKEIWVLLLWLSSFGMALWLGLGIGSGDVSYWLSIFMLFPIFLTITTVAWLFRLAYLAGRRSR